MTIEEMQTEQMRRFQKEYDEMELPRISDSPVRKEIRVPMSDGVRLQTILYLPAEDAMAGGRVFPVILQRSPYYASLPQYSIHSNYPGVWSLQEKTRIAHQTIWCGEGESAVEIPVLAEENIKDV